MKVTISHIVAHCTMVQKETIITYDCHTKEMITLPKFPTYTPLRIFFQEENSEKNVFVRFEILEKYVLSQKGEYIHFSDSEEAEVSILRVFDHIVLPILFGSNPLPNLVYQDVTEYNLLSLHVIHEAELSDIHQGLWAYHGLRKFQFQFSPMCDMDGLEIGTEIIFYQKQNEMLKEPISMKDVSICQDENEIFIMAHLDTDVMGEELENHLQYMQFLGTISITLVKKNKLKERYDISLKLILQNTNYQKDAKLKCALLSPSIVSIDFGTSSTCVAVQGKNGVELLSLLTDEESSYNNIFENPTSLMIYDWEKFYQEWNREIHEFPAMKHGTKLDYLNHQEVHFDIGYSVQELLEHAESDDFNSILTQLKTMLYTLEKGKHIEMHSVMKQENHIITIVDSPDLQNETSFDPIAFYAYCLGRTLNHPSKSKIYTKFYITYPVKFRVSMRDKLRKSLEYGLKRSIPLPLRDACDPYGKPLFSVEMKYTEPVAYMGAICGKYLKATPEKPALFAVYDFGGGTLDFSFGMFRLDEDEEAVLDIFGIGGDMNVGGEHLISQISYWIYMENKKILQSYHIPFLKPEYEPMPNDFPEHLLRQSNIAKANVRKIDELFSRKLFKNLISIRQTEVLQVELYNQHNEKISIEISVEYLSLQKKLRSVIANHIKQFKASLEHTFLQKEEFLKEQNVLFQIADVQIFKSGNASKNIAVEEIMEIYFPNNEIHFIDEMKNNRNYKKYAITPKTAVAFGQLSLSNFEINGFDDAPFQWNIYHEKKGSNTLEIILPKNCPHKNWVRFGVVKQDMIELICSSTEAKEKNEYCFSQHILLKNFEKIPNTKFYLYIRIYEENAIEYCVLESTISPDHASLVDLEQIIPIIKP